MGHSSRKLPITLMVAVALLVANACGSTVPPQVGGTGSTALDGSIEGDMGVGVPDETTPTVLSESPSTTAPLDAAPSGGSAGGEPTAGAAASPAPGAPQGLVPAGKGVKGVTDKVIRVGVWYRGGDSSDLMNSFGANEAPDDAARPSAAAARAVADDINANGGIAGRKLELVLHEIQGVAAQEQEYQAACADWTEDHQVFAIMATVGQGHGCATATNTILLSDLVPSGVWASEESFKQTRGLWYGPTYPLTDRRGRVLVDSLWQRGFFGKGAKVAIMVEDKPYHREGVAKGMIPALARHGIKPIQIVDSGAYDTYVLQMRRERVTHVLWSSSDGNFLPALLMMRAASSQQYFPKWGFGSDQAYGNGGIFGWPREQMVNTTGIGWLPLLDTGLTTLSGSANARRCIQAGKKAGQPGVFYFCEVLFLLQAGLNHATEVSHAGLDAGMGRLGTSFSSVQNLEGRSSFRAGRHDGPAAYRAVVFNNCTGAQATCFRYEGPARPF